MSLRDFKVLCTQGVKEIPVRGMRWLDVAKKWLVWRRTREGVGGRGSRDEGAGGKRGRG